MRIRFALLLMVAGLLVAPGAATAQTTTGDYTTPTPTGTYTAPTPTTTTETEEQGTEDTGDQGAAPETQGVSGTGNGAAPAVAGTTQAAPSNLAFTGAEPLLLIVLGLAAAGGTATLLVRDRQRASQDR